MRIFQLKISQIISQALGGYDTENITPFLESPSDSRLGDVAFPCFRLSKILKKSPNIIAQELCQTISSSKPDFIEKTQAAGGYLNFFVSREALARAVLDEIYKNGENYGRSDEGRGKTVVIDYSSPNIARPFHIGHLYSTLIGAALYKMYAFLGHPVVGINYLGDWGTQFGKLITAYFLWSSEEAVKEGGVRELLRVYVKYHAEAEERPELDNQAREWLLKMERGDETALNLWKWFRDISVEEYDRSYKRFGIHFDSYNGESFYNDKMRPVVEELREKGLLEESDGAMIVRLDEYKMPPCLILRSDGGTLYPTRDIASAFYRRKEYNFYKSLYVTDARQALHFAQWMKVVGLMGYDWESAMIHITYGLLTLEEGAMSIRKGNFIFVNDLIDDAKARVIKIIDEKNPELPDKEAAAEQIAIGAIFFSTLYNSRRKDVVFSLGKMLSFDGETGPYVQYTHTRANSILEKAGENPAFEIDFSLICDDDSAALVRILSMFGEKVAEAAEKYEPFILSRYIMELAQAFNKFYHSNQILSAGEQLRNARLLLVYCVKIVLKSGLSLLGISAIDKM